MATSIATDANTWSTNFLTLPLEVRCMVYDLVLGDKISVQISKNNAPFPNNKITASISHGDFPKKADPKTALNMIRTNQAIRGEVRPIFYQRAEFTFWTGLNAVLFHMRLSPDVSKSITTLTILSLSGNQKTVAKEESMYMRDIVVGYSNLTDFIFPLSHGFVPNLGRYPYWKSTTMRLFLEVMAVSSQFRATYFDIKRNKYGPGIGTIRFSNMADSKKPGETEIHINAQYDIFREKFRENLKKGRDYVSMNRSL